MSGKTIGLDMNNGFAGSYARQPDMIINTHANVEASANIPFGHALMVGSGGVKLPTASITAADFAGVASRQVQSQIVYNAQNGPGEYKPNDPVSCFQRGRINVECKVGTPALNGAVYIAISTANGNVIGCDGVMECNDGSTMEVDGTNYAAITAYYKNVVVK